MPQLRDERVKGLVMLALIYVLVAFSPTWVIRGVTVVDDGHIVRAEAFRGTVADALQQLQVPIAEGDRIAPGPDAPLRPGMTVAIERAVPGVVAVDGQRRDLRLVARTVGEFLQEAGVELGPLDRVVPSPDTPMTPGTVIRVTRVHAEEIVRQVTIPYETWRWAEPKWEKGRVGLLREGRPGLAEERVRRVYEDGELVEETVLSTTVVQEPRAEIIGVGTRVIVRVMQTPAGLIRYSDMLEMEATAYYPGPESTGRWADGRTATGVPAGHGVVAVDPGVIPLGTRVYIPGYGIALAADVGSAIRGHRIDLAFDTYREALHYGRRWVKVYILVD
ncbi:MAG TPA: ubiquitin-like domain-containing protein [Limnochordales bacterium]|nr:ubiquitin-like domain-containing protein [Limnochordales bacterium]